MQKELINSVLIDTLAEIEKSKKESFYSDKKKLDIDRNVYNGLTSTTGGRKERLTTDAVKRYTKNLLAFIDKKINSGMVLSDVMGADEVKGCGYDLIDENKARNGKEKDEAVVYNNNVIIWCKYYSAFKEKEVLKSR